jgi:4-alpha-glucanotransferase
LQFAFDGHADNPYLPHNFVSNTVVYTGTHDNAPTREWYEELPDYQRPAELKARKLATPMPE